ncbi:MAG: hypothetical protein LBT23_10090, partial [Synergistaceae bacterium]|jgi:hypothetical protein|nr:hypothetical protein [Synergistaceae bacterium]
LAEVSIDHVFLKALEAAGIQFPISKQSMLDALQDASLRLSDERTIPASSLIVGIEPFFFDNGAAFLCAFHSALYRDTYRKAFLCARSGS